uniref:Uncharacterized protein n=1 Tax=Pipistrellus kuhlii TaxID=59472 RepID=A0A7J7ULY3_PIPKU|nr:hypothetical protein mPipKuh1_008762 [Pipistrellus kuhlii]
MIKLLIKEQPPIIPATYDKYFNSFFCVRRFFFMATIYLFIFNKSLFFRLLHMFLSPPPHHISPSPSSHLTSCPIVLVHRYKIFVQSLTSPPHPFPPKNCQSIPFLWSYSIILTRLFCSSDFFIHLVFRFTC